MNTKSSDTQGFFRSVLFGLGIYLGLSIVLLLIISAILLLLSEPEKYIFPLGIFSQLSSALSCGAVAALRSKRLAPPLICGGVIVLTVLLLTAIVPGEMTLSPIVFSMCCILSGLTPLAGGFMCFLASAKKTKRKKTRRGR